MYRSFLSFIGRWFPKFQSSSSSNGGSSSSKRRRTTGVNTSHIVMAQAVVDEAMRPMPRSGGGGFLTTCDIYHKLFQECVDGKEIRKGRCQIYKGHLLSDCNAIWDGTTIQYPVKNGAAHKNKT